MTTFPEDVYRQELGEYLFKDRKFLKQEEVQKMQKSLKVLTQEDLDTYKLNSKDLGFTQRKFRLL